MFIQFPIDDLDNENTSREEPITPTIVLGPTENIFAGELPELNNGTRALRDNLSLLNNVVLHAYTCEQPNQDNTAALHPLLKEEKPKKKENFRHKRCSSY